MFIINETLNADKIPEGKIDELSSSMRLGSPVTSKQVIFSWWDLIRTRKWPAS